MGVRPGTLVVVVVLAGCTGWVPVGPDEGSPTTTIHPDNPWGKRSLTIGISTPEADTRDYSTLVQRALGFWEVNAEQYAGYPIDFEVSPAADDPDIIVRFVPEVTDCEAVREAAGCAPYVTNAAQVDRPMSIQVLAGLADASTVMVLKHEFGHLLGLNHSDKPQDVMAARQQLLTLPMTNATDRPVPWRDSDLTVYVDFDAAGVDADTETIREQVNHALEYYEQGANGTVPTNVSFTFIRNRSAADIVIAFPVTAPCGDGQGSCGSRFGVDPDGDQAPEWYTRLEIEISGIPADSIGWHVGYWLGYGYGFTNVTDWPTVFRNESSVHRQSEWWNETGSIRAVSD